MNAGRLRAHLLRAALAVAVALVQFRIVVLLLGKQYRLSVEAAQGVLTGEPHWQVFQSRLLGPWLVELLSPILGGYLVAHVLVSVFLLAAAGYVVLTSLTGLVGRDRALLAYFVHSFLVLFCISRPWLYIWDFVDVLLFAAFCDFVVRRRDYRWFAALFAVAVLNRQSAFYVAGWMIVDPPIRFVAGRLRGGGAEGGARLDVRMVVAGVVLLAAGVGLTEYLQRTLLVREVGPALVGEVQGAGPRYHMLLGDNLRRLAGALTSFNFAMSFLVPSFVLGYLGFCAAVVRRDAARNLAIAGTHVALLLSTVAFTHAFETRVYLLLLPFVAFYLYPAAGGARAAAPGT